MCKVGFEETNKTNPELIKNIEKNICDGGYEGENWKKEIKNEFGLDIEITQRTDIANGIVSKIRWISERSFAWLDKNRRLSKNYEATTRSIVSMIVLSFIRLLCRRLTGNCTQKWVKKEKVKKIEGK